MASDLRTTYHRAAAASFTYREVGATAGPLPEGYDRTHRRVRVGRGREALERAGGYVLAWGAQRGAGFEVYPGAPAAPGLTALVVLRPPGLPFPRLVIPCRVVWTVREADRVGFAYGTLPGHPLRGEEAFVVRRDAEDVVWFEVTAFSRPGPRYARWGRPVTRWCQARGAARYLRAVATTASAGSGRPA
ncbi:DUF1990 family protein [Streptomyces sp. NPDC059740]|uniref:DUF1990 family protein n=1 Tax=Streptomyces sp. NPDC059740 TaxID=3346926 RepID=UPI003658B4BE